MFFLHFDYFILFLYMIGLGMVLGIIAFRKNFTYLSRLQKLSVVLIGIGVTGIFLFLGVKHFCPNLSFFGLFHG